MLNTDAGFGNGVDPIPPDITETDEQPPIDHEAFELFDGGGGDPDMGRTPNVNLPSGRTDLANARRFVSMHGDRVRFCHPWGKWLVWDGARWKADDDGAVHRLGKAVADAVWSEAGRLEDNAARQWAARSASDGGIRAMLNLAASEVPVLPAELDANPWLLNVPNGTIDLRTGEHREHRREDNLTKLCPVPYSIDAATETWDQFVASITGLDAELATFVQRFSGYCATGSVREQTLAVFHGTGSNGKSTFLEAFMATLGSDYAGAAPRDLLMTRKGQSHPTELADLFGRRFVVAQENEYGRTLAESLVKQLTGGDTIKARRMREDYWAFEPTHKLVLCTNHKPKVRGRDHAIWRRLRLVPFSVRFEGDRKDKDMPDKLSNEREGILSWIVQGAADWHREGLTEPDAVRTATDRYRTDSDTIGKFLNECCVCGPALRVKASTFTEELDRWCKDVGESIPKPRVIAEYLTEQGFTRIRNNGSWYEGLGIKAE